MSTDDGLADDGLDELLDGEVGDEAGSQARRGPLRSLSGFLEFKPRFYLSDRGGALNDEQLLFEGELEIAGETAARAQQLVVLSPSAENSQIQLRAEDGPARALLLAGAPLNEPIVQIGPFVMNSRAEIDLFAPTPEHALLGDTLRAFVDREVEPQAADYDRSETFNHALFLKAGEIGFLGVTLPDEISKKDVMAPTMASTAIQEAVLTLYKDRPDVAILLELMTDFDEGLQEWRYRHVKMVERTIGNKKGTGGSMGVEFLKKTLFQPIFPDLWAVRHRF